MQFQLSHDVEAPLSAVEQALLSPALARSLQPRLSGIRSLKPLAHELDGGVFRRIWRYRAEGGLPLVSRAGIGEDMMIWDEHSAYRLEDHQAEWFVVPRPAAPADALWRRRFHAAGTYRLAPLDDRTTRRTVAGKMNIRLPLIGLAAERLALSKIRKNFGAEADALRSLCARS